VANPTSSAESDPFREAGLALFASVSEHLAPYIERRINERSPDSLYVDDPLYADAVSTVARQSAGKVLDRLHRLVIADIDDQPSTPLEVLRGFVPDATAFLAAHMVAPVGRDRFSWTRFPEDLYDLTPANLAALGDEVGDVSIIWGATKAFEHRKRHSAETPPSA
jgi:hypothetical protein